MNLNLNAMMQTVTTMLTAVGLKIVGAIVIWMVGRWLIGVALRMIGSTLRKQKIDPTLETPQIAIGAGIGKGLIIVVDRLAEEAPPD